MRYLTPALCLATVIIAANSVAQDTVYKSVDDKGVTSFSDQPSPGAKSVEVKPNIVNVTPVKPLPPSAKKTPKKTTNNRQPQQYKLRDPDDYDHGYGYNYNDDDEYQRQRYRRAQKLDRKHRKALANKARESGLSKPRMNNNSRPTPRPAARAGSAPRASIGGGRPGGGGHP